MQIQIYTSLGRSFQVIMIYFCRVTRSLVIRSHAWKEMTIKQLAFVDVYKL